MQYEIVPERTCILLPSMCILQGQMCPEAGKRQNGSANHSFPRKRKAQPFGWTFYGAGDEPSPPRAAGTPMVALPSSRQCPTIHRTVGWNCSSLFHPKKKSPAVWLDFFGAGDEPSPPRAAGTPIVALPSSRQCPTVHRTVGFNCSSLVTRKKSPAVWLDFLWSG